MPLQHLVKEEVIPSLPNKPEIVWDAGASFIEGYGSTTDDTEIPSCNSDGKKIPSEIGPMKYDG
jgi:hypothetical protein